MAHDALMGGPEEPCRRCESSEAWLLRPVQEIGGTMPVEAREIHHPFDSTFEMLGWYEARICCGCGHTLFFAREYQPERATVEGEPCSSCDATAAWIVAPAPDRSVHWQRASPMRVRLGWKKRKPSTLYRRIAWRATLSVRVCRGCGLASWTYSPDPLYGDEAVCEASPRACRRCSGPQRLATVMDDLGEGRDVAARGVVPGVIRSRGRFIADTCEPCGTVDWYGTRLDDLEPDEKRGVFRLLPTPAATNDRGGPYR